MKVETKRGILECALSLLLANMEEPDIRDDLAEKGVSIDDPRELGKEMILSVTTKKPAPPVSRRSIG